MSLGPNAGSAHITVKPSLRGWSEAVRRQLEQEVKKQKPIDLPAPKMPAPDPASSRESGRKAGDEFSGGFDRMVRKRIQASLNALPKAQIGVASSEAEQKLKDLRGELDDLSKKRIGVDVDSGEALAKLQEVQGRLERISTESADIEVKADTILASAQLAAIHREVNALDRDDVTIDVNTSGASAGLSSLSGVAGILTSKLVLLAGVGVTLIPVVAVVAVLGATLIATLAAAAGGIGFLLAAVVGAVAPVLKAQAELKQKQEEAASAAQAYASAQQQVASAAAGVASAETSAARAIADAQRAVADARRNSARSISAAEDAVTSAERRRIDAQDDLTTAVEAARKKLADYQNQLRSAALDESGAALSVTQAQEALNEVLSDPTATQLQIDLARQSLKESQLNYDEATKRRKDLREQAKKDRAAGVQGDKGVQDAKDRLAEANLAVKHAETQLSQARADGARSVAAAERNLARARADGARQVSAAKVQLAQAQAAEAAAATKLADAQGEVSERLAKMKGPASVFVKALDRAKAAWKSFIKATAPATFGLAAKGLDLFTTLLPKFVPLVKASAAAVGGLLDDLGEFANGPEGKGFIDWLTRTAPVAITSIGKAIGNIVVGIGGLIGALFDTDTGFLDLTRRFAEFGKHAGKNSSVRAFFDYAKKNAPIVADFIKILAKTFATFMRILAPFGTVAIKVITALYRVWQPILKNIADRMQATGRVIKAVWDEVIHPVLGAFKDFLNDTLVPAVKRGVDRIGTIWDGLRKSVGTPVKFVVDTVWNNGLRKVINAIPGVSDIDPVDTSTWPSFAKGGVLPGHSPGRDIHRFVSPTGGVLNLGGGEGILTTKATDQIGGARGINFLNRLAEKGRLSLRPFLEQSHFSGGVVYVDGEPLSRVAAAQLAVAENASGIPMRVIQGSYQAPSSYSGTSHTGGGVMDTYPGSFLAQSWLRKVAFAAWARNIAGAASAGSGAHVHSVSLIDPTVTNLSQLASYRAGGDGLGGADYGPRPAISAALLAKVRLLTSGASFNAGAGASATGSISTGSGGILGALGGLVSGNPLTKFLGAIDKIHDFAKAVPDMLSKLSGMGAWGKLILGGVKSMGGSVRSWVNGKLPGSPFPDVFDSGGLARGRGYLRKDTISPERVLSPAQTAAFERQVATLDHWDRTARALAAVNGGPSQQAMQITRFKIDDWEKGLGWFEYTATSMAEQVYQDRSAHAARIADLAESY